MRKIYTILAVVMCIFAFAACQQEKFDAEIQEPVSELTLNVLASMDNVGTRATLIDGESLAWSDTDEATAWSISKDGQYGYGEYSERNVPVTSITDGNALFQFSTLPQGGKTWIAVNSNSSYDGCSAAKVEFQYAAEIVQDAPGALNPSIVNLISDEISVPVAGSEGQVSVEVDMNIVGTIMRFLVYSSNGTYKDENVKSVELVSVDNNIAGNKACMAYNFVQGGKYLKSDTEVSDECVLYWESTSKSIKTSLTEALSLSGVTEAKQGTGIYMAVPPVEVGGYKYIVTTDVARYIFDSSDTPITFAENTLKNVPLNLENDNVSRMELSSIVGELIYEGGLPDVKNIPCDAATGGISYWYARTKDEGADWVTRENRNDDVAYYTDVNFSVTDEDGNPVEWIKVYYREGDTWWDYIVEANESPVARTAVVTATFSDVNGYVLSETYRTKTVKITQAAYSTIKTLTFFGGIGDKTLEGTAYENESLGYCVIVVNGTYAESWSDDKYNEQLLYGSVEITPYVLGTAVPGGDVASWLTVGYGKDKEGKFNSTHLLVTASENNTAQERKALVYCKYVAPEGYEFEGGATEFYRQFIVTQKSNVTVNASLSGVYTETIPAVGGTITAATLSVTVNGEGQTDVAAAMTQYGVSVTATGGATATVAANGEISLVIPENKYKNGGKEYTVTVKYDGAILASATVNQAEGTEIAETPAHTFSYTIYNNVADGSNNTGFGPGAGSTGDWYRFESITIDGTTYLPGEQIKNLSTDPELMPALMAQAFKFGEITEEDVLTPGVDPLTVNPESFVTLEPWTDGGAAIYVRIVLTQNDSGAHRTFKIITSDGDGVQKSSIVYFQNN